MNFLHLEDIHKMWNDVLVIGKTIERDNEKYHIVGMTSGDETKLYIIEPYSEPENYSQEIKGIRNQRKIQKEYKESKICYLHCSDFYLGDQRLQVQGGSGGSLRYSTDDYEVIKLFFDFLCAGWVIPEWLKNEEWDNLQLVTLRIADMENLPEYSPEMPIIIKHRRNSVRHILEKTITLNVGKSRSFSFTDHCGDEVRCFINNVTLIDVWKEAEEQFSDPRLTERFSEEQLQEAKAHYYKVLEENCPRDMRYIGVEYECSKDIDLQFYSKEFLKSVPTPQQGSSTSLIMSLKPDKELGTHNLCLKGCAIQTAVSPDTTKIPAELFSYFEKIDEWEENV